MEIALLLSLCLVLGALGLFLARRPRSEPDEGAWALLLLPEELVDAHGKAIARRLGRHGISVRLLSETGLDLTRALRNLTPRLILAHQPVFGKAIETLSSEESALASTPVLYLETGIRKNLGPLRVHLAPGASLPEIASSALDLMNRLPGPQELSRRKDVALDIAPGNVMEFLHFLHTMGRSGRIEIRTGALSGSAWMERGRLVHATLGSLEGLEALHGLLDLVRGSITFTPDTAPKRRSILDGAMAVLADYSRRRDERAKASGN